MYNRKNAVKYAEKWWNKRNPNFYNFDSLGGDCTNFISQCLFAGGIKMSTYPLGWYYKSLSYRTPSWTGVQEFFNYATSNKSTLGVSAKVVTISELEIGDVVQMLQKGNRFHHNLLVTKIDGINSLANIKVSCHTNDAFNKPLSDYYFQKIRFLKILN